MSFSGTGVISGIKVYLRQMLKGRWRSWLSHLSNTQKVLSSNLGRLIYVFEVFFFRFFF